MEVPWEPWALLLDLLSHSSRLLPYGLLDLTSLNGKCGNGFIKDGPQHLRFGLDIIWRQILAQLQTLSG